MASLSSEITPRSGSESPIAQAPTQLSTPPKLAFRRKRYPPKRFKKQEQRPLHQRQEQTQTHYYTALRGLECLPIQTDSRQTSAINSSSPIHKKIEAFNINAAPHDAIQQNHDSRSRLRITGTRRDWWAEVRRGRVMEGAGQFP